MRALSAVKASRGRSCWRGVSLCVRGAQKIADLGRGGRLCVRGDRSCLAGRGGVPHLGHHRRGRCERHRARWLRLGVGHRWRSCCPWKGSSAAIWIPERNCSPRSSSQFSCAVPDLPGTRSTQAGRGVILPSRQVYDAGEFTWAPSASVLVMPHMLINPQYPHACEAGRVIRCGLQTRLDMGPHGIPRSCELPSQSHDDQHCMTCTTCGSNGTIPLPSLPIDARLRPIVQPAPAHAGSGLDLYEELNGDVDHVQVTEAWHHHK